MLIHLSAGDNHVKINGLTFQKGTLSYHTEDNNVSVSYLEKEIITYTDYTLFLVDEAAVDNLSELTEWMDSNFFCDASFDGGLQEVTDIGNTTTRRIVQVNNGILKESTNNASPSQISPSTWTIHRPLEWSCWSSTIGAIYIKLPVTSVTNASSVYSIRGHFRHRSASGTIFSRTEFEIHIFINIVSNTSTPVYLSNHESDSKILPVRLIHQGGDVRIVLGNTNTTHIGTQCVIEEIVGRIGGMGEFEMGIITSFSGYTIMEYPATALRYQATQDWVTAQTNLQQVTAIGNTTTHNIVLNDNATFIKNSSSGGVKDVIRFNTTETKGRIAFEQTVNNGANFTMFLKHGSSAEKDVMSIYAEDSAVRFKALEGPGTRYVTALPDGTLSTSFTGLGTQLLTASASLSPGVSNVIRFDGSTNNYDLTLTDPLLSSNETITITNANGNNGGNINFAGSYLPYEDPSNRVTVLAPGSHVVIKSILISGTWTWVRVATGQL
ncbi:MAG: hypothetical protein KL787_09090 [Taibaiella sp.]|nr:hypothetical protein [Taibaiella sp.]